MDATTTDLLIQGLGAFLGASAAVAAALTYRRNARTKAAEFLLSLHKTFFVDETYKSMKKLLDSEGDADQSKLTEVIAKETVEFTDFLNFFELIAYFAEIKTLTYADVEALLGYYLNQLQEMPVVYAYIKQESNGFENLSRYLVERVPN